MYLRLSLCLLFVLAAATPAGEFDVLTADPAHPPRGWLRARLLAEAGKQFDARRAAVAAVKTPADLQRRQQELRRRFLAALGGLPERTPLAAQVVGTLRGNGYRVEKVIYQSRPNHHVTASFYLPDGNGPFPGVLMPIGHSMTGKAADYIQRGARVLARHGIAVLAYDPIGQGERRQLLADGKSLIAGSTGEHTMIGVGALLVGECTATYRIWDGLRSLDYLASRSEVDAKRLGCTGCSGGGTLTSYLAALDERIVAAAPSCYITSLERLFATIGPQDAEQNIPGQVAFGMEHADYLTLRAPRPTLICAATRDFFDIQGTWTSFREAKRLYTMLGHAERIDLVETDTPHGFPPGQRQAMLRFMLRWLVNRDVAAVEQEEPSLFSEAELRCTRTGQVVEDLAGVSAFGLNARREKELAARRAAKHAGRSADELRRTVAARLRLTLPVPAAEKQPLEDKGPIKRDGYTIRKVLFETTPGVQLPGLLFRRNGKTADPLTLLVHGEGKAADAAIGGPLERRVRAGEQVLALDLRGLGELSPTDKPGAYIAPFGPDTNEAFLAMHLDRPLLGQRVGDLLAVIRTMAPPGKGGVRLVGVGRAGPAALHAALLEPAVTALTLQRSLVSWASVVHTPLSRDQLANVVPGVLADYDLPDLAAALAPRPLHVETAADGAGRPLGQEALVAAHAAARAAYQTAGAGPMLTLQAAPAAQE